ncbi:hypothetical protein V12B01_13370 [Vibrio splendidus 12B01]|nr:hypothetical protein V12B01_13370 [Vibrio splendidus 12B01]
MSPTSVLTPWPKLSSPLSSDSN